MKWERSRRRRHTSKRRIRNYDFSIDTTQQRWTAARDIRERFLLMTKHSRRIRPRLFHSSLHIQADFLFYFGSEFSLFVRLTKNEIFSTRLFKPSRHFDTVWKVFELRLSHLSVRVKVRSVRIFFFYAANASDWNFMDGNSRRFHQFIIGADFRKKLRPKVKRDGNEMCAISNFIRPHNPESKRSLTTVNSFALYAATIEKLLLSLSSTLESTE